MNALDPCPDDLLARAANAPLAPAERDLLAVHLARCATCRTAADVTGALADEPSARAGDELLIARLAERAAGSGGAPRLRLRRALRVATAVAAAAAAAAGIWYFSRGGRPEPADTAQPPTAEPAQNADPPAAVAPRAAAPPAAEPGVPPPAVAESPPVDRRPARRQSPTVDIDRLLSEARAARARGDNAHARILYARVVRLAPGTPAAAVAEVAIGLMLIERADASDARAARKAFDRYLAAAPAGALREEAMAGRARALELLGERARAINAWQEVLAKYPRSLQAPLARRRLEALRIDARGDASDGR